MIHTGSNDDYLLGIPEGNHTARFMVLLGYLAMASAGLDSALDDLLDLLARTRSGEIASILFDGESYDWKMAKCRRLIDANRDMHDEAKVRTKALIGRARDSLNERNRYIHSAYWSYNDETGTMSALRFRRNRDAEKLEFTVDDLRSVVERAENILGQLRHFITSDYESFLGNRD